MFHSDIKVSAISDIHEETLTRSTPAPNRKTLIFSICVKSALKWDLRDGNRLNTKMLIFLLYNSISRYYTKTTCRRMRFKILLSIIVIQKQVYAIWSLLFLYALHIYHLEILCPPRNPRLTLIILIQELCLLY